MSRPRARGLTAIRDSCRERRGRCAKVIQAELALQGIALSLSSVKRTLTRYGYGERSPWKRTHRSLPRPVPEKPGDLVQIDTIHLQPDRSRFYVYTLLDVASRWAHAAVTERISTRRSVRFVRAAQARAKFPFTMLQSDWGSEWSTHFSERIGLSHRHSRVRTPNDKPTWNASTGPYRKSAWLAYRLAWRPGSGR